MDDYIIVSWFIFVVHLAPQNAGLFFFIFTKKLYLITMKLNLLVLKDFYAICRFDKEASVPQWIIKSDFYNITKTPDELSLVCNQDLIKTSETTLIDKNWRCIKIDNLLDLSLTGIIAEISKILKESKIPIFTISTYNTDYIFVKDQKLENAIECLKKNGHHITIEN